MKAEEIQERLQAAGMLVGVRQMSSQTAPVLYDVDAVGTPAQWEALLTLPYKEAMALAALKAGLIIRESYYPERRRCAFLPDGQFAKLPSVTEPLSDYAAAAEALELKPWTGRD